MPDSLIQVSWDAFYHLSLVKICWNQTEELPNISSGMNTRTKLRKSRNPKNILMSLGQSTTGEPIPMEPNIPNTPLESICEDEVLYSPGFTDILHNDFTDFLPSEIVDHPPMEGDTRPHPSYPNRESQFHVDSETAESDLESNREALFTTAIPSGDRPLVDFSGAYDCGSSPLEKEKLRSSPFKNGAFSGSKRPSLLKANDVSPCKIKLKPRGSLRLRNETLKQGRVVGKRKRSVKTLSEGDGLFSDGVVLRQRKGSGRGEKRYKCL
jgi:hypothetical protein